MSNQILVSTRKGLFEVKRNGAPWYVVVTGLYTTRSAATTALRALPTPLAKQQPWPRAVSTLK